LELKMAKVTEKQVAAHGEQVISTQVQPAPQPLPDTESIMTLGVVVAVSAWGIVEVLKLFFRGWKKGHAGAETPWYWAAFLRLAALVVVAALGTVLYSSVVVGSGGGWPWGTFIGLGSGALCAIIVGVVKRLIRARA